LEYRTTGILYPIFVATSTSPQRILDSDRSTCRPRGHPQDGWRSGTTFKRKFFAPYNVPIFGGGGGGDAVPCAAAAVPPAAAAALAEPAPAAKQVPAAGRRKEDA